MNNAVNSEETTIADRLIKKEYERRYILDIKHSIIKHGGGIDIGNIIKQNLEMLKCKYNGIELESNGEILGDTHYFDNVDPKRIPSIDIIKDILQLELYCTKEEAWNTYMLRISCYDGNNHFILNRLDITKSGLIKHKMQLEKDVMRSEIEYIKLHNILKSPDYKIENNPNDWNTPEGNIELVVNHLLADYGKLNPLIASGRAIDKQRDLFER